MWGLHKTKSHGCMEEKFIIAENTNTEIQVSSSSGSYNTDMAVSVLPDAKFDPHNGQIHAPSAATSKRDIKDAHVKVNGGKAAKLGADEIVTLHCATKLKLKLAAACFGKSMGNDPTMTWLTGGRCPDRLVGFFNQLAYMALKAAPNLSTCWTLQPRALAGDKAAATSSSPLAPKVVCISYEYPRNFPSNWTWIISGLDRVLRSAPGLRATAGFMKMVSTFDKAKARFFKEHGPFLYICCFGTAPKFQGQGLGSELMREVLAYARKLGVPAFLEAGSEDSCRFYKRNGFRVLQEYKVDPEAPSIFFMAYFHG